MKAIIISLLIFPLLSFAASSVESIQEKERLVTKNLRYNTPNSLTSFKWNPGHYLRVGLANNKQFVENSKLEIIKNQPNIKGVLIPYRWSQLEPVKGQYDFKLIWYNYNYLRSIGKRLFIQIQTQTYGNDAVSPAPLYMESQTEYGGGFYHQKASNYKSGYYQARNVLKTWVPEVKDRLFLLHKKLGEKFDSQPFFEGIMEEESSTGITVENHEPAGYTTNNYVEAYKDRLSSLTRSFPSSNVIALVNFVGLDPGQTKEDHRRTLDGIMNYAQSVGAGVGAPDLYVPNTKNIHGQEVGFNYETLSYPLIRKRKGKVPIGIMAMWNSFRESDLKAYSMKQLFDYGVDEMGINYFFWQKVPNGYDWRLKRDRNVTVYDAFKVINDQKGRINK